MRPYRNEVKIDNAMKGMLDNFVQVVNGMNDAQQNRVDDLRDKSWFLMENR